MIIGCCKLLNRWDILLVSQVSFPEKKQFDRNRVPEWWDQTTTGGLTVIDCYINVFNSQGEGSSAG